MSERDAIRARFERLPGLATGDISSDYDLNDDNLVATELKPAAVLVALRWRRGAWRVVLTRRRADLRTHPGQVAFPGGRVDPGDDGVVGAALREAQEEIGLDPGAVRVLGQVDPHVTITSYHATPVLGVIEGDFDPVPEPGEVEAVFDVPLLVLMDPGNLRIEGRNWQGKMRRYYVIPFGPFYIWGATARMIVALADMWRRA